MDDKTTFEEYRYFVSGQIDVLKHITTAMAAFYPQRDVISKLANNVLDNGIQKNATTSYINGIKDILLALEIMLNTVKQSEQGAIQDPPDDN